MAWLSSAGVGNTAAAPRIPAVSCFDGNGLEIGLVMSNSDWPLLEPVPWMRRFCGKLPPGEKLSQAPVGAACEGKPPIGDACAVGNLLRNTGDCYL